MNESIHTNSNVIQCLKRQMEPIVKKPVHRMVEALKVFRDQVNKLAPNRSKVSDGWIGDVKHQARHSDHNPEPDGTVDAFDLTNDPNGGVDTAVIADELLKSRDPRISYIICNGRIASGRKGPKPWTWRKYTGKNGHYHHMHLSVLDEGQDDKTPWKIDAAFKKSAPKPDPIKITKEQEDSVLHFGSKGDFVKELQKNLVIAGYGPLPSDGFFGVETEKAVKDFQQASGLKVDGWAGPRTLDALGKAVAKKRMQPKLEEAEHKVDVAKKVVDKVAGKSVSTTEVLTGVVGAGGTISVVKQGVDNINDASESVGQLLTTLGPWLVAALVVAAAAAYIIIDKRRDRLAAKAAQQVL